MSRLGLPILLIIAFLATALVSAFDLDRRVAMSASLVRPLSGAPAQALALPLPIGQPVMAADASHVHLSFSTFGADHVGVLNVRASEGPVRVTMRTGPDLEQAAICQPAAPCRIVLRLNSDYPAEVVLAASERNARIEDASFEAATSKRHAAAGGGAVLFGFAVLVLIGPLLVALRRWPGAEQLALIGLGLVWIAAASLQGLLIGALLIIPAYGAIRWISAMTSGKGRALVAALSLVVLAIIFVKFAAPAMAAAFANPGGLWLALPLGISYFAIRIVDLLLSAYSGALKPVGFRDYLAFMVMPHTLPAGPVQTFADFQRGRIEAWGLTDFGAGVARAGVGVGKKLIADTFVLPYVTGHMGLFLTAPETAHKSVVVMLVANVIYVYLDFSAYCDLAIGAARAGGRRVPENFDWPLVRTSMREFWRRWHMTLSQWVMRRVYLPAFLASRSTGLAMLACMMVIGLWHAPNLPWALWAVHHSAAMTAEAAFLAKAARLVTPTSERLAAAMGWVWKGVGLAYVWAWVALGHSFTLFSSPQIALKAYWQALCAPFALILPN